MLSFAELIESRRRWLDDVLAPWCRTAGRKELLLAEQEWTDLAGRAAPEMTLWAWAWSRFPELCHEGLTGINETVAVTVRCRDGRVGTGFPDARESERGELVLVTETGKTAGPFSIDDIVAVERVSAASSERDPRSLS